MLDVIDDTLDALESRRIGRREAVARLGGLALALAGGATVGRAETTPAGTFKATGLNHIALRVQDLTRSRDFYRKHLGLAVLEESEWNCFLDCGPDNFVALFRSDSPRLDHYCYTVEGYEPAAAVEKLKAAGLEPVRRENRVYFDDPDGLTVQVSGRRSSRPG